MGRIATKKAKAIQQELRERIKIRPLKKSVDLIAGGDLSFNRGSDRVHAGIVILRIADLTPVARSLVTMDVGFPYIPGLLAFREIPPLERAWEQLEIAPDVLIMDGHGLAHPRRMGIATHFGILRDQPTIGCAKNVLVGDYEEPGPEKGAYTCLTKRDEDGEEERIGIVLRSRTRVNPIFVSPGHLVDFDDARRIVMRALGKYKLPETTRQAHRLVNELRRGEVEEGYFEY